VVVRIHSCHNEQVSLWSKLFRCTALFLVLFTAGEVLACDVLPSDDCSVSHSSSDKSQGPTSGDNCMCCCAHVLIVAPPAPVISQVTVAFEHELPSQRPVLFPLTIDHPPQLS
jgi:hypothetical protein